MGLVFKKRVQGYKFDLPLFYIGGWDSLIPYLDMWQVGAFPRVFRFPTPIKLTAMI